jgi:hypothetical protein
MEFQILPKYQTERMYLLRMASKQQYLMLAGIEQDAFQVSQAFAIAVHQDVIQDD